MRSHRRCAVEDHLAGYVDNLTILAVSDGLTRVDHVLDGRRTIMPHSTAARYR